MGYSQTLRICLLKLRSLGAPPSNHISILFHHYQELKECISEVEQIEGVSRSATDKSSSNKNIDWLTIKEEKEEDTGEEEQKEEMLPTTLDGYFLFGY